jgi:hypothetical protein
MKALGQHQFPEELKYSYGGYNNKKSALRITS